MRLFILLLTITFYTSVFAQPKTLSFDHLMVENGLPENFATSIIQDQQGYIWIGTQNGLVRYDGYNTRVFQQELLKDPTKKTVTVNSLYIDKKGQLWAGTRGTGIYRYNPADESFTNFLPDSISAKLYITKIVADKDGDMWLRCYVSRGSEYHLFRLNLTTKLLTEIILGLDNNADIHAGRLFDIYSDIAGQIWFSTSSGIYTYDKQPGKFSGYLFNSDTSGTIGCGKIYEAPSQPGTLYIANAHFDKAQTIIKNFCGFTSFDVASKKGTYYPNLQANASATHYDSVFSFYEDSRKSLWLGTANGLVLFNREQKTFTHFAPNDKQKGVLPDAILWITEDRNGGLWMAGGFYYSLFAGKGLQYFDPVNKRVQRFLADNITRDGLASNNIQFLFADRARNIWMTYRSLGVQRINWARSRFKNIKPDLSSLGAGSAGTMGRITETGKGKYYVMSRQGLLEYDTAAGFKIVGPFRNKEDQTTEYQSYLVGSDGIIWVACRTKGLISYNPATGSVKNYVYSATDAHSVSSSFVAWLYEDGDKTLWVATGDSGLCRFNRAEGNFTRYPFFRNFNTRYKGKALDDSYILSMFEDDHKRLWIGTNMGGLNLMDKEKGTFTSYWDPVMALSCVCGIQQADSGRLWIGSYLGGVALFDPAKGISVKVFNERNGLLADVVTGIRVDGKGDLWIASQRGLSILDAKNFTIRNFTSAQGLPDNNIVPQAFSNQPFTNSNGEMFISYINGFFSFNPADLKADTVAPATIMQAVSYVKNSNSEVESDTILTYGKQKIKLDYDQNRVTFYYTGLHFENSRRITYQYKLEGYDKNWIMAGTLRNITYTNLSPGTYTFLVKSANMDGVWNETPASIIIVISPPWWKTWWAYLLFALLFVLLLGAFISYRSRKLKRENAILEDKITHRTSMLQQSIEDLKSTQAQLVQSEKMASLGELTAGIAHEIQNPLNFVNNFSEINKELIVELKEELKKGNLEEVDAISNDIEANEEKINHHGKRADAIVKGMLQHSRISSGVKEPTDINALCDEYLRLSYHGLRAKDKSFNATLKTEFDNSIGNINIIPQDMGRVILNLITNAFYAVDEKAKSKKLNAESYEPTVCVSTKTEAGKIFIQVSDNGNGIQESIINKIFQPFFTTKPTGQGTGLGLSLSYDIVKAHGGELKVETKEGAGTTFTIQLPVNA